MWADKTLIGATALDRQVTVCFDVAAGTTGNLIVTLVCPDAASPASPGLGEDQRRLGVMVASMRLMPPSTAL